MVRLPLEWRHNEHGGVSNYRYLDYLLNRLFRRRSKKTSKLRVAGLCEWNSPVTGEFPSQKASNAENVSIWWRRHVDRKQNKTVKTPSYAPLLSLEGSGNIFLSDASVFDYIYDFRFFVNIKLIDLLLNDIDTNWALLWICHIKKHFRS